MKKLASLREKSNVCGDDLEFRCETSLSLMKKRTLAQKDFAYIEQMFEMLYQNQVRISLFVKHVTRIRYLNEILAAANYRGGDSPYSKVIAWYPYSKELIGDFRLTEVRPAIITSLYEVKVIKLWKELSNLQVILFVVEKLIAQKFIWDQ